MGNVNPDAPRRRAAWRAGWLTLLLVFAACAAPQPESPPATLDSVPEPDLTTLESLARDTLRSARVEAGSHLAGVHSPQERARALGDLARAYHAYEMVEPARAAYAAALGQTPADPDLLYLAGRLELDHAEFLRAADLLARATQAAPGDSRALAALARARRLAGDGAGALLSAEAAVRVDPAFGPGWLVLAEAASDTDQAARAVEAYSRFFALHAEASKYRAPYAQVLRRAGRAEEAARQLAMRGDGVPAVEDPRLLAVAALRKSARAGVAEAAKLIEAGAFDSAMPLLAAAELADPGNADVQYNLGVALLRQDRASEALPHFENAARLKPADVDARFSLAVALGKVGRPREAEAAYLAALELEPEHAGSLQNLGNLRVHAGRPAAALEPFRALVAAEPTLAAGWLGQAAAEIALGDERGARATLERARAVLPNDWRLAAAWCRLVSAARDTRVRDGAAAVARARRIATQVTHPEAFSTLAMALAETGDFAGAIAAQERALALTAPTSNPQFLERLRKNLALYRRGVPCREPGID